MLRFLLAHALRPRRRIRTSAGRLTFLGWAHARVSLANYHNRFLANPWLRQKSDSECGHENSLWRRRGLQNRQKQGVWIQGAEKTWRDPTVLLTAMRSRRRSRFRRELRRAANLFDR